MRIARTPPGEPKPILDNVDKMLGFVPNLQRLTSISPNALCGWATLMGTLAKTLDVKTRDGIALTVSEADGCGYCLAAYSFTAGKLKNPGARNRAERGGALKRSQASGCGCLRESAHRDARQSSEAQFAAVRDAGWTDANIVEMIALTAQFVLTNFMNNAVQTPIDFPEVSPAKAA